MRRMQDDEIRMLQGLRDGKPFRMSFDRAETIVRKLRYHGLIDASESLTARGRHVASKLPPLPELESAVMPDPTELPIEHEDWD